MIDFSRFSRSGDLYAFREESKELEKAWLHSAPSYADKVSFALFGTVNWKLFESLTVLDLFCGASDHWSDIENFPPYFAHILGQNGADSIGIDVRKGEDEDFVGNTRVVDNLVTTLTDGSLREIPEIGDKTFDWINCIGVFCDLRSTHYSIWSSPALDHTLSRTLSFARVSLQEVLDGFLEQSSGLLKEGGFLHYQKEFKTVLLQKTGNSLTEVENSS